MIVNASRRLVSNEVSPVAGWLSGNKMGAIGDREVGEGDVLTICGVWVSQHGERRV